MAVLEVSAWIGCLRHIEGRPTHLFSSGAQPSLDVGLWPQTNVTHMRHLLTVAPTHTRLCHAASLGPAADIEDMRYRQAIGAVVCVCACGDRICIVATMPTYVTVAFVALPTGRGTEEG